jgi:ArsR family transcriptional regulator
MLNAIKQHEDSRSVSQYRSYAGLLHIIGHPVRLQILDALTDGPACVCELIVRTGRRQACISQHLMLLRQVGLVKRTREGLNMRYEVVEGIRTIVQYILQGIPEMQALPPSENLALERQEECDTRQEFSKCC